jgi:hypothetical protein
MPWMTAMFGRFLPYGRTLPFVSSVLRDERRGLRWEEEILEAILAGKTGHTQSRYQGFAPRHSVRMMARVHVSILASLRFSAV